MKKCILPVFFSLVVTFFFITCSNSGEKKETANDLFFEEEKAGINSVLADTSGIYSDSAFIAYQLNLKQVEIDNQHYYVIEGDLLLDEDELYYHYLSNLDSEWRDSVMYNKKKDVKAFTISTINDNPEIWPQDFIIRYAVLRNSFNFQNEYDSVVKYMKTATADWMNACGVQFEHINNLDYSPVTRTPPNPLTFVVRKLNANGSFIAQAFFPSDPPHKRRIFIDPSFFSSNGISKPGILRHELGHIIGARHEQIWSKEYQCQGEEIFAAGRKAKKLTEYDPYSVMHYLCGSSGTKELNLTPFDIEGSQKIYGLPKTTQ